MNPIKTQDTDTAYFDVDDTLIIWRSNPTEEEQPRLIHVEDAFGVVSILPNSSMINKLKHHKLKGDVVVVWSQGGSDWAEAVVKHLQLDKYVDIILTKPTHYYDDLEVEVWMPKRIHETKDPIE